MSVAVRRLEVLPVKKAKQLLQRLGETADAVAKALDSEGIRGVRNTARFLNPIVRLIHMQVGDDSLHMDVMRGDTLRIIHPSGKTDEVPLPAAVKAFLDAFNQGTYPELEVLGDREGT